MAAAPRRGDDGTSPLRSARQFRRCSSEWTLSALAEIRLPGVSVALEGHASVLSSRIRLDLLPCVHTPIVPCRVGIVSGAGTKRAERHVPEIIQDRVLRLVAGIRRIPIENVSPENTFEDLGMDSLDKLNLLFEVENEFEVEIDDQEAKQICRVSEMVTGVTQLVEAKEKSSPAS